MEKIKVAICDDLNELCLYYQTVINQQPDMEFVGSAHNTASCSTLCSKLKPDILLLDIQLETIDAGIKLIPIVNNVSPDTKIVMLTVHEQDDCIFSALAEGAKDFLLKTTSDDELIETIHSVNNGENHLSQDIVNRLLKVCNTFRSQQKSMLYIVNNFTKLSPTEIDILHDICNGLSYKKVADKRFIEEITVRTHVSRILKKFEYNNMKSLVKVLTELKIFDLLN